MEGGSANTYGSLLEMTEGLLAAVWNCIICSHAMATSTLSCCCGSVGCRIGFHLFLCSTARRLEYAKRHGFSFAEKRHSDLVLRNNQINQWQKAYYESISWKQRFCERRLYLEWCVLFTSAHIPATIQYRVAAVNDLVELLLFYSSV